MASCRRLAVSGVETWTIDTRATTLTHTDKAGTAQRVETIGSAPSIPA